MDIRDTIPSYVFPVEKGDNSPVFNVLQTIDRWTIGERPITENPIASVSARSPLEKQSEHSNGNKIVVTASEFEPYKIFRPWETQSINVKETDNSTVIGKYVDLEPDVQKCGSVYQTMDKRDTILSNVFPEAKESTYPVFNVLQTIDSWTIGERPISDSPMPSGSARPPLEKLSENSDGNKTVALPYTKTVSELKPYTIVRPCECQSRNVKQTHNSTVIGKYVESEADVQKEKKITDILEVTPADVVADHSTPTSYYSKPKTNITLNDSTFTQHGNILEIQDKDNILKTRKSFQHSFKKVSNASQRTKKKSEKIIIYDYNKYGYNVTEMSNFNTHVETHTKIKTFARTRRDYRTDIISNCTRLMRTHTNRKQYACKVCSYSTAIKGNLGTHMRIHTNEKPYACIECNYSAARKSSLIIHMRNHTNEKPYKCNECNYSAAHRSNLIKHMRIHTKEKPYACNECKYSAAQKNHLNTHMRIHTKEKPYSCKECNYSAAQRSCLIIHMRIHTNERPYACNECNYSAASKSHLKTHMRIHTKETPYSCKECKYSAAKKCNLNTHMRTYTKEKLYA